MIGCSASALTLSESYNADEVDLIELCHSSAEREIERGGVGSIRARRVAKSVSVTPVSGQLA